MAHAYAYLSCEPGLKHFTDELNSHNADRTTVEPYRKRIYGLLMP